MYAFPIEICLDIRVASFRATTVILPSGFLVTSRLHATALLELDALGLHRAMLSKL